MGRTGPRYHPNCQKMCNAHFLASLFFPVNAGYAAALRRGHTNAALKNQGGRERPASGFKRLAPAAVSLGKALKGIFSVRVHIFLWLYYNPFFFRCQRPKEGNFILSPAALPPGFSAVPYPPAPIRPIQEAAPAQAWDRLLFHRKTLWE